MLYQNLNSITLYWFRFTEHKGNFQDYKFLCKNQNYTIIVSYIRKMWNKMIISKDLLTGNKLNINGAISDQFKNKFPKSLDSQ